MTKPLTPLNAAIKSQLAVMEHVMHNLTATINDAQDDIAENNRNGAVGALMECESGFKNLESPRRRHHGYAPQCRHHRTLTQRIGGNAMKLVKLIVTPKGNPHGEVVEVTIDPNPGVFKSRYVHVVSRQDGCCQLVDYPPNIDKELLDQAFKQAVVIIDMVYDIISGF